MSWIEVRVESSNKKGFKFVQHGIGQTEAEAVKSAFKPRGYSVKSVKVTQDDIDPESTDLFRVHPMFEKARKERKQKKLETPLTSDETPK